MSVDGARGTRTGCQVSLSRAGTGHRPGGRLSRRTARPANRAPLASPAIYTNAFSTFRALFQNLYPEVEFLPPSRALGLRIAVMLHSCRLGMVSARRGPATLLSHSRSSPSRASPAIFLSHRRSVPFTQTSCHPSPNARRIPRFPYKLFAFPISLVDYGIYALGREQYIEKSSQLPLPRLSRRGGPRAAMHATKIHMLDY